MNREKILHDAVETFGQNSQMLMMAEEMSELTKEISKFFRATNAQEFEVAEMNIREEMVDVQIVMGQMRIMFGYDDAMECRKLERLKKRIAEHRKAGTTSDAPTVDAKERRKWLHRGKRTVIRVIRNDRKLFKRFMIYKGIEAALECSVCKDIILADARFAYKYCPNCGAKMDLKEDA